jgi:hypothetical protein
MSFDLPAIAERLRRAGEPPEPNPAAAEPGRPPKGNLASSSKVSGESAVKAAPVEAPPPATTTSRRGKRRRWLTPGSPAERRQQPTDPPPADQQYPCPFCSDTHQPVPLGGRGLRAAYSQVVAPEPGGSRPEPLGRAADDQALVRDRSSVW